MIINGPKLRFPEFRDEWRAKQLGELTEQMQSGLSRQLSTADIGMPVIRSNNLQNQTINIDDLSYWHIKDPQGANTASYILKKGDLLVNFINSLSQIGKFSIYNSETGRDTIFTTNIMRLRFNTLTNSRFVSYQFSTKRYTDYIDSITKPAVNQASFTTLDFKKFKLYIPSNEEQQKIADFLTVVDDRINLISKKVELLKKYKKSVMQKIFSQQIRFNKGDGLSYPELKEKVLGQITKVPISDGPHLTPKFIKQGVLFLSVDNLSNGKILIKTPRYISRQDYLEFSKKCKPVNGDILFGKAASVGNVAIANFNSDFSIWSPIAVIRVGDDHNNRFIYYALQTDSLKRQIRRYINSSSQENIGMVDISKLKINVPALEEQQKIANLLTALDDKIDLAEKESNQAKQFKKALLQRMFV